MEMTELEIVNKFERNGRDKDQIGILADLNAVPRDDIISILIRNGYSKQKGVWLRKGESSMNKKTVTKPRPKNRRISPEIIQEVIHLSETTDLSQRAIARQLDISTSSVTKALRTKQAPEKKEDTGTHIKVKVNKSKARSTKVLDRVLPEIDSEIKKLENKVKALKEARAKIVLALRDF